MCYDRLAKRFGAYDAATLQPFLSRRLITWYAMFPVSGPAAGGSDSDGEGGAADMEVWAGALVPIQTRRRPSLVIDGPPLVQPLGEIKCLHITCLAKRAAPLEAEIAHSAGGPGNREANCRTFFWLEQGILHTTSHVTSYTTSQCYIAYDKAYDIA